MVDNFMSTTTAERCQVLRYNIIVGAIKPFSVKNMLATNFKI